MGERNSKSGNVGESPHGLMGGWEVTYAPIKKYGPHPRRVGCWGMSDVLARQLSRRKVKVIKRSETGRTARGDFKSRVITE